MSLKAQVKAQAMNEMLKIKTTRFGELEIDQDKIIFFVDEILGFPEDKRFVLIPHKEDSPFIWLQSIDNPELAFVVTNPLNFFENYNPKICETDIERLEIDGEFEFSENLLIFLILTIPEDPRKMTANLKAPIIINAKSNKAKQVILLNEEYTTKHLIF